MTNDDQPHGSDRREPLGTEPDAILDEIDDVLEENAEDFVRAYVGKGGQGFTDYILNEVFNNVIVQGIATNASWDLIKLSFKLSMRSFRDLLSAPGSDERPPSNRLTPLPEGSIWDLTDDDGWFRNEEHEQLLKELYERTRLIPTTQPPRHDWEEAFAVHSIVYTRALLREGGYVQLQPNHHRALIQVIEKSDVQMPLGQLVAHIISGWLRDNPNATSMGSYRF